MESLGRIAVILGAGALLAACQTTPVAEDAAALGVDFTWSERSRCSPVSPAIKVTGVPEDTAYLKVTMKDLNKPNYRHGGGEVAYEGSGAIAEGALGQYKGPCPPMGQHTYRFTVEALNADKNLILGVGQSERLFPE